MLDLLWLSVAAYLVLQAVRDRPLLRPGRRWLEPAPLAVMIPIGVLTAVAFGAGKQPGRCGC